MFKKGLPCSIQVEYESERILVVKTDASGKDFAIVNVYAPNGTKDKLKFFENFVDVVRAVPVDFIVICGDFNCM